MKKENDSESDDFGGRECEDREGCYGDISIKTVVDGGGYFMVEWGMRL